MSQKDFKPAAGEGRLASIPSAPTHSTPRLRRRLASMVYESLLLFGVIFIPAYLFSALAQFRGDPASPLRYGFQMTILAALGTYFVWCWRRGGQTLPMKTWKFRLEDSRGGTASLARCVSRYTLTWAGPLLGLLVYKFLVVATGFGTARFSYAAFLIALPFFFTNFLWALVDRDRQFLHDRLAGTRLAMLG
ncbi:MAG: RDD family protein [Burkholderiales bacterium]